jgi:hypothetical protein
MSAYLIIDVGDLLRRLQSRAFAVDLHDLANRLRGAAALAAGLPSPDSLKAIAVADWNEFQLSNPSAEQIFEGVGFEMCNIPDPDHMGDALMIHYFSNDPEPVDEMILVSTSEEMLMLASRVAMRPGARVRVWADAAPDTPGVIFQPLEAILGIQSKSVSLYIDFENIAISLNEQGYAINLDRLIEGLSNHASAHGQILRMAAYAPWGQRGSLPPLVDGSGREISDEAPSKLALANIDPVFNLPGKNSADMRIAKDVLADSTLNSSADIYIIASGDRDFNEVFGALRNRNKQVIVWGVRGSTSRQLENNPSVQIEYLDDFLGLQRYQTVGHIFAASLASNVAAAFGPSQWSSVILQFDRIAAVNPGTADTGIPMDALQEQLRRVSAVVSSARGRDLVSQAVAMGILSINYSNGTEYVRPVPEHSVVERTRLVRDRLVLRVANTLDVRGWEYVNYGFLLKGIAMDRELDRPGMNIDDSWRSEWVDCLVREGILLREMVPHRHNPDDLVPVIRLSADTPVLRRPSSVPVSDMLAEYEDLDDNPEAQLVRDAETNAMMKRIVISVDQFTSYRGFTWCPLGSLHKRLRAYDSGVTFQRAVEWLQGLNAVRIDEYDNPQSAFKTKGISLNTASQLVQEILAERNSFVHALLKLYNLRSPITVETLAQEVEMAEPLLLLWTSIMEAENILNPVHGKPGQYSLFRTHHTVNLVAESMKDMDVPPSGLPVTPIMLEAPDEQPAAEVVDDEPAPAPEDEPPPPKTPAKRATRTIRRKKVETDDTPMREE